MLFDDGTARPYIHTTQTTGSALVSAYPPLALVVAGAVERRRGRPVPLLPLLLQHHVGGGGGAAVEAVAAGARGRLAAVARPGFWLI